MAVRVSGRTVQLTVSGVTAALDGSTPATDGRHRPSEPLGGSVRIVVFDPSESYCRLVALWLESHADLELVGVAHHCDTAAARIADTQPDVVVLDAKLHSRVALLPAELRTIAPATAVVIHSAHTTRDAQRVAPGADAYVQKRGESRELIEALRAAEGAR